MATNYDYVAHGGSLKRIMKTTDHMVTHHGGDVIELRQDGR